MDSEINATILITYDGEQYEIEYIYYSINPDRFEIREIYDASGEEVDDSLYEKIERYCRLHLLERIREELMAQHENFSWRIGL